MNEPHTTTRPLSIYLAFTEGTMVRTLHQTIGEPIVFVHTHDEAELIIFSDPRQVELLYDASRRYCYFPFGNPGKYKFPPNVKTVKDTTLGGLLSTIQEVMQMPPLLPIEKEEEVADVALLTDALRILVIDDSRKHIVSAKKTLAGHKLTIARDYRAAMMILATGEFDVVLTDLHLPMSSQTMGDSFELGTLVPYGMLLAIEAARKGAKKIAIVTDANHHNDAHSAAFDHFSHHCITIEGAKVRMLHAHTDNGAKNWLDALNRIE